MTGDAAKDSIVLFRLVVFFDITEKFVNLPGHQYCEMITGSEVNHWYAVFDLEATEDCKVPRWRYGIRHPQAALPDKLAMEVRTFACYGN